jgi:hypothetical protein
MHTFAFHKLTIFITSKPSPCLFLRVLLLPDLPLRPAEYNLVLRDILQVLVTETFPTILHLLQGLAVVLGTDREELLSMFLHSAGSIRS